MPDPTPTPPLRIACNLTAGALIIAVAPLPYAYYSVLRVGVIATAIAVFVQQGGSLGRVRWIVLAAAAPFLLGSFEKEVWAIIDVAAAIVFASASVKLRSRSKATE